MSLAHASGYQVVPCLRVGLPRCPLLTRRVTKMSLAYASGYQDVPRLRVGLREKERDFNTVVSGCETT